MNCLSKRCIMRLWWTVGVLRRDFGRQAAAMPSITVDPPSSLIDEPVSIAVSGLAPSSRISIRSTLQERGKRFEAAAHFIADQQGRVNLCEDGSVGGSFVGKINLAVFGWVQVVRECSDMCPHP